MSNVKNYAEPGGDKWVVGGTLEITAAGQLLLGGGPLAPAANQADSAAADLAGLTADFNALLAKLQAAGLMAGSGG